MKRREEGIKRKENRGKETEREEKKGGGYSAVDIGNESGFGVSKLLHETVPSRLHGFAVSSPAPCELIMENQWTAGMVVQRGMRSKCTCHTFGAR